ncbi:MAG: methyltransferase [Isosphaeraceae bacterium]
MTRTRLASESWTRFTAFVPEMRRPGFAGFWLTLVVATGMGLVLAGVELGQRLAWGALLWQAILVGGLVLGAYCGFWRHRQSYRARYGDEAYRRLFFRFVSPTAALIVASAWTPLAGTQGPRLPDALAWCLVVYLLATAALIAARGRELFWNLDLRAFVYSVFPDRGIWVASPLFDRLRHPIYSAAVRSILAVALLRNNVEAIACALLVCLAFRVWAAVEDAEMIERYPAYEDYRRAVPALAVVRPGRWAEFMWFLLLGSEFSKPAAVRRATATPTPVDAAGSR